MDRLRNALARIEPTLGELERDYRLDYLQPDKRQTIIAGAIFIVGDLAFVATDYALFSQSSKFYALLLTRGLTGCITLGLMVFLTRITQPTAYDRFVFLGTMFVSMMSVLFDSTRPTDFLGRFMIYLVLVFAIYLVVPNRLLYRLIAALFVSGASIVSIFSLTKRYDEVFGFVAIVCLLAANLVGVYASARYYRVRRKQYQSLQEAKRLNEKLIVLAETDSLTGILNRRKFFELGEGEFARFSRYQSPLSVAILDLDFFKRINDTYGHPTGDQVLKIFASMVLREIRGTDHFGRLGGEEFGLLLTETLGQAASHISERIRRRTYESMELQTVLEQPLTISLGVCSAQPSDTSFDDLVRRADQALYRAKSDGRNRVVMT